MKRFFAYFFICLLCLGCAGCSQEEASIAATTLPVYQFTETLCRGTGLTVTRLITEPVSCLHDYTLTVGQMRSIEAAQMVVCSGAGLEDFMAEALDTAATVVDASAGIQLLDGGCHHHEEAEAEEHHHEHDAHIWLSPGNAAVMAENICRSLEDQYPQHSEAFRENLQLLQEKLQNLEELGRSELEPLSCRELVTFHDGFAYLAHSFDLEILEAIEEESDSEASAGALIHLIELVEHHQLPAIFTETNGSASAAAVVAAETGVEVYTLDMTMSGDDYFEAMERNIRVLKEALS